MADNELNIKVSADGETIKKLEAEIKKLRDEFKSAEIGSKAFNDAGKQLKDTLEKKSVAMATAATENAKMMKSYFTLGEELRGKTLPLMTSFSQIVQDAPYGIRGIANNITFMTQQFTQLTAQGASVKNILQSMLSTMTGPAGILLAVSVVTSLATALSDTLFKSVEKANSEIDKLKQNFDDAMVRAGLMTKQVQLVNLHSAISNANLELMKLQQTSINYAATIKFQMAGGKGVIYDLVGTPEDILKQKTAIAELLAKVKQIEDEEFKQAEKKKKALDKEQDAYFKDPYGTDFYRPQSLAGEKGFMSIGGAPVAPPGMIQKLFDAEREGALEQAEYDRLASEYAERREREAKQQERAQHELVRVWKEGHQTALAATNAIGAGIRALGQNLLGVTRQAADAWDAAWLAMENTAINALTAVAEKIAEAAILDLFVFLGMGGVPGGGSFLKQLFNPVSGKANGGWIQEPVIGIGASGQRYTFGERGPEYVVPNHGLSSIMTDRHANAGSGGGSLAAAINKTYALLANSISSADNAVLLLKKAETRRAGRVM